MGHIINTNGLAVDPAKVKVTSKRTKADLMVVPDGCTLSVTKIKLFLGMVLYYQHFMSECSSFAKPLFALTSG